MSDFGFASDSETSPTDDDMPVFAHAKSMSGEYRDRIHTLTYELDGALASTEMLSLDREQLIEENTLLHKQSSELAERNAALTLRLAELDIVC